MYVAIWLILYMAIGGAIILGALRLAKFNQYDMPDKRVLLTATTLWPICIILMLGYWGWAGYHLSKNWIIG